VRGSYVYLSEGDGGLVILRVVPFYYVYLPGVLFTGLVGRKIGGDSGSFLRTAALAEFAKLFLTGLLCALVFIWVKPLAPGWFFTGMIAVLATSWFGLARAIR
jgi:hypothetical protein